MITVFESHLPPEFLEAAAAQYNALATLGQAIDVPAAQQAAEPLRAAVQRVLPGKDYAGLHRNWKGEILISPTTGRQGPGVFVFLTRHNRGGGTLSLARGEGGEWEAVVTASVGLAVYVDGPMVFQFKPTDEPQAVLWCGP